MPRPPRGRAPPRPGRCALHRPYDAVPPWPQARSGPAARRLRCRMSAVRQRRLPAGRRRIAGRGASRSASLRRYSDRRGRAASGTHALAADGIERRHACAVTARRAGKRSVSSKWRTGCRGTGTARGALSSGHSRLPVDGLQFLTHQARKPLVSSTSASSPYEAGMTAHRPPSTAFTAAPANGAGRDPGLKRVMPLSGPCQFG